MNKFNDIINKKFMAMIEPINPDFVGQNLSREWLDSFQPDKRHDKSDPHEDLDPYVNWF